MLNLSPCDHIEISEHVCRMWESGKGGESGGVDISSEHTDGYATKCNVPHTRIKPQHVETAQWIRQGWGEQNNYQISCEKPTDGSFGGTGRGFKATESR